MTNIRLSLDRCFKILTYRFLITLFVLLYSPSSTGQSLMKATGYTNPINITYVIDSNGEVWSWGGYHESAFYVPNIWALGRNWEENDYPNGNYPNYGGSFSLPGKVLKGDYESSDSSITYLGEKSDNPVTSIITSLGNKGNNVVFITASGEVFYMGTDPEDFIDVDETDFKKSPTNIWSLTDVATYGKVIDAALDHNTMIIITNSGKIFARGYFKNTSKSMFNDYSNESNLVDWGNDSPANQSSFREIKNIESTLSGNPIQVECSGNYPTTNLSSNNSKHSYFIKYDDGKLGFLGALKNKNNNLSFNPFPGYDSKYIYGIKAIIDGSSNVLNDVELLAATHNSVMIKRSNDESVWYAGRNLMTSGESQTNFTKVLNQDGTTFDATNIFKIDNTSFEFYAASTSGIYRWGESNGANLNDFDISYPTLIPKGDYQGTSYIGDNTDDPILDYFVGDETLIVLTNSEKKLYALGLNNRHQLSICPSEGNTNAFLDWWKTAKSDEPREIISSITISSNGRYVSDCSETFSLFIDPPPTMTISSSDVSSGDTSNDSSINLNFTANEATSDFDASDISVSAGSIGNFTVVSSTLYTATLTPSGDATYTIDVNSGVFTDAGGNGNIAAGQFSWTYDATAPTLSITGADTTLIIGETSVVTFTFSEDVLGFTDADITLTGGGSLSGISATSSQVFSGTLTPPSNTTGTVTVTVGATAYTDIVSNDNTATATIPFTVDTQSPTLSSVSIASDNTDSSKAKVGDTIILTFTTIEAIQSPTVTIDGNAATISGSGSSWTATYILQSGDTEGTLSFTIDFDDLSGNTGTQVTAPTDSSTVTFDESAPTVDSIVTDDLDDKVKDTDVVRVTTTFSESMASAPSISIDLPNGTDVTNVSMTQSTTADVWYYDWRVSDGGDGVASITVSGTDLAGNAYAGADTDTLTTDNTAPTLSITGADTTLIIGETSVVTFTFSEDVLGFTDADITLTGGGSLSGISATSSQVFSGTLTPPSNTTGTVTVTVGATAYTDIVSNDNTATATIPFTVDTKAPTTTALEWSDVANLMLTVSFSEAVYSTNSGSGSLTTSDFTAAVTGSGFSAVSISQVTQLTPNSYSIILSTTGTGAGEDIFEILPVANSIFDLSGNEMSTSQTVKNIQYNSKPSFSDTSSITITVNEGATATVPFTGRLNAIDSDGPNALVYNIKDMPSVGSLTASKTLTGDISYTHDGSEGKSDTFNFIAYDGASNSDPIDVNVVVNNVNDLPLVSNITNSLTVVEDTLTDIDLSNITITDPDVAPEDLVTFSLSVLSGSISANATVSVSITQTNSSTIKLTGTATDVSTYLDTTSNVSYLSAQDENGINKDVISYIINDNAGSSDIGLVSTTQVDITNTNDAPIAVSQTYQANLGDGVITSGTVSGSDIDPLESLSYTVVTNPSYGSVIMDANGDFTYTHDGTASASDSFTFTVNDGEVDSAFTATATLSFNQSPVLQDQSFTVLENRSVSLTPVYTDNENDPISSYAIVSQPTYGTVVSLSDGYQYNHGGTNGINTDTFTIKVNDGYSDSGVATITMNITPVNDPPVAPSVNLTINEGESSVIDFTATDEENMPLSYISISDPNNGQATLNESSVSYSHDGSQSERDIIIYSVSDGVNTVTGTINISIVLVNDPPVVPTQIVYVHENESVSFNLNAFDEEGDAIDSYALESETSLGGITIDSNGSASFVHTRGLTNESIPDSDYSFVYPDSFSYQVSSFGQTSNIGTVQVLVIPFDHDQDGVASKIEDLNNNGNFMDDDTDNDGIPNFLDVDDDNDTIPTLFENFFASIYNGDSDNDGTLNYLDEDDDNDGILTKFETSFNQFFSPNRSSNVVRHKKKWDYNPKRWTLSKQYASKGLTKKERQVEYKDTDGDEIPDFADVDDDGDGVLTKYEVPDQNGDGSPNDALDSDQESVPNYLDIDDDDDGVLTKEEFADQNGDGIPNDALDSDQEQIPNYLDIDDDNDSILTFFENPDQNGDGVPDDAQDSDSENIPDYLDVDDDNDNIPTINEIPDQNGDGIPDDALNSDNEDTPNYIDVDDDNDQVLTIDEDDDGDGNPLNNDRDNDGLIDAFESSLKDIDEDGVSDEYDSENKNPNNDQDGDGFGNLDETLCGFDPLNSTSYPFDIDVDGTVDCLDDDIDGDGILNEQDNAPESYNPDQLFVEGTFEPLIPEVFSPNGDGINDTWNIINIDRYPNTSVWIFTRTGKNIFEMKRYNNNFDGTNDGNSLPEASYYYMIDIDGNESIDFKGWLYLTR
ncbi:MAG: Ig-like domain-containing protein [Flavobacteriaceae bacterium]